jgi:hypothetical protein
MRLLFVLLFCWYGLEDSSVRVTPSREHHFLYVYNYIRQNIEGNYVYHPNDKGGETYGGIAKRLHPNWYGWRYIKGNLKRHQIVPEAEPWVLDFYLTIWVHEGFENIKDRELALNLFDFRIHSSPRTVSKMVTRALLEIGECEVKVGEDWIDDRFNRVNPKELVLLIKIQRILLFNYLVNNDPSQVVFYHGWINRITNI